jgi:outer membrane protein assembly factor BamE
MNNIPGVYTLDIQQGNRVSQAMINELKPNMKKRQVLYVMGSPMLVDVFHKKRWDYLYSNQPSGQLREQKRISLYFEGDTLVSIQGDFKPTKTTEERSKEVTVEVPKRDLDKTMSEKILGLFEFANTVDGLVESNEPNKENLIISPKDPL